MEEHTTHHKQNPITKYLVITSVIVILFFVAFILLKNNNEKEDTNTFNTTQYEEDASSGKNNQDVYASITDKAFVEFATTVIEKKCPFYKPDGVTYRTCLSDWEQELNNSIIIELADEVHNYCSTFTGKYADETSLEGQELFLKCSIYKFQ